MLLDIGCGHSPTGDVNIDLFIEPTAHRSPEQCKVDDVALDVKHIPNFICADACYLPIRDNTFNEVYSSHTIEHVSNPFQMLKEMTRVAKKYGTVIVKCPHRFAYQKKDVLHKTVLNITTLSNAFRKCGLKHILVKYTAWRYIPHTYVPIVRLPIEIQVSGKKR